MRRICDANTGKHSALHSVGCGQILPLMSTFHHAHNDSSNISSAHIDSSNITKYHIFSAPIASSNRKEVVKIGN